MLFEEFAIFIKNPLRTIKEKSSVMMIIKLLGIWILIMFPVISIIGFLKKNGVIANNHHPLTQIFLEQNSVEFLISASLSTIIFTPFIEELAFRLHFNFNKQNITLSLSALFSLFIVVFLNIQNALFDYVYYQSSFLVFLIFFLLALMLFAHFKISHLISPTLYRKYLPQIILINNMIFALLHFRVNPQEFSVFSIFAVLPYFVSAYVFSFARMKAGFVTCYLLHALSNLFIFLVTIPRLT